MPQNRVPADHRQEIWDILRDQTIDRSEKIEKLKVLFAGENFLFLSRFTRGPQATLEDVEILAEAIKDSPISEVNFNGTRLNPEMLSALLDSLKKKAELTHLKFSGCVQDPKSVDALASALKENGIFQGLKKLDLSYNSLANRTEALQLFVTNTVLTDLNLSHNRIGDEGAISLANSLKENVFLSSLNLRANPINSAGIEALADMLKENEALRELDLSDNILGMDAASLKALAEALKENKTLNKLTLHGLEINPMTAGMEYLAELLKHNGTLTTLNLGTNKIRGRGIEVLADALKTNTGLTSLSLSGNALGFPYLGRSDEEFEFPRDAPLLLAKALEQNRTLTYLNLSKTKIHEEGAKCLLKALEKNTILRELDLSGNPEITQETLNLIQACLNRNRRLAAEAVEAVPGILIELGVPKVIGGIVEGYLKEPPESLLATKIQELSDTYAAPPNTYAAPPKNPSLLSRVRSWIGSVWDAIVDFFKKLKTKLSSTPDTLSVKNQNTKTKVQSPKNSVPPPQEAPSVPKVETTVPSNNINLDESSKPEGSSTSSSNKKVR